MAKDYVGLNICVRDIFGGPDDCAHDEWFSSNELNSIGFTGSVADMNPESGGVCSVDPSTNNTKTLCETAGGVWTTNASIYNWTNDWYPTPYSSAQGTMPNGNGTLTLIIDNLHKVETGDPAQHSTFKVLLETSMPSPNDHLNKVFEISTNINGIPTADYSRVGINISDIKNDLPNNDAAGATARKTLAGRIVSGIGNFFHFKFRNINNDDTTSLSSADPHVNKKFLVQFEFCSKNARIDSGQMPDEGQPGATTYDSDGQITNWNTEAAKFHAGTNKRIPLTTTSVWHNDLPGTFTTSWNTLNALNLHRNGPFGFCSWKMIRNHDKPIVNWARQNNKMTFEVPGKQKKIISKTVTQTDSGPKLQTTTQTITTRNSGLICVDEPCVISKHHPVRYNVGKVSIRNRRPFLNRFSVKTTYNNDITLFSNIETNKNHNVRTPEARNYNFIKSAYLKGAINTDRGFIDQFEFMKFRQTVYPPEKYTFKSYTRSRKNYKYSLWKEETLDAEGKYTEDRRRHLITAEAVGMFGNDYINHNTDPATYPGSVKYLYQSRWPMDAHRRFAWDQNHPTVPSSLHGAMWIITSNMMGWNRTAGIGSGAGILQNRYAQGSFSPSTADASKILDERTGDWAASSKLNLPNDRDNRLAVQVRCAPYFARLNTLKSPRGYFSPGGHVDLYDLMNDGGNGNARTEVRPDRQFTGTAYWDTPLQTGRTPFYANIEQFYDSMRPKYKDYSIIPEFKISDHVEFYSENGIKEHNAKIFDLNGALTNHSSSVSNKFYEIYSTSDFLKNFDVLIEDHKDFVEPSVITLTCKAVKKLLPYDGFYPIQRSVQLADQFYKSYFPHTEQLHSGSNGGYARTTSTGELSSSIFQNVLTPLFAPGVLYNTIKSGVACDYPILLTANFQTASAAEVTYSPADTESTYNMWSGADEQKNLRRKISSDNFDLRIPFEAIVKPEDFLAGLPLIRNEPDFQAHSKTVARWNGDGDNLYTKMANNFIAEIPNFFLRRGELTHISSLPQDHPNFGNAEAGKIYRMRVKMYKSMTRAGFGASRSGNTTKKYEVPQVTPDKMSSAIKETITMYSSPAAFGPPTLGVSLLRNNDLGQATYDSATYDEVAKSLNIPGGLEGQADTGSFVHETWDSTTHGYRKSAIYMDSSTGWNFPYTPPYYHGQSWADITFEPKDTKKYTLSEILSASVVHYTRFDAGWATFAELEPTHSFLGPQSLYDGRLNRNAMQLSCSVNLFSRGQMKFVERSSNRIGEQISKTRVIVDSIENNKTRWVIQPKFETPILNFNYLTGAHEPRSDGDRNYMYSSLGSNKITRRGDRYGPTGENTNLDPQTTLIPRGMWHQYGQIPRDKNTGIFMQVTDIPRNWLTNRKGISDTDMKKEKSLADLVGFKSNPKKLGKIASAKKISEAVVAIPFIEKKNRRQFFAIPRRDIENVLLKSQTDIAGESVRDMVMKMKKYILPPSMDFVRYADIKPFAMYIFEFEHLLSQQDLSYIWQGVMPDIAMEHEEAVASITHELLANELLGGGAKVINTGENGVIIDEDAKGEPLDPKIKWLVFKAKRRANTDYDDIIIEKKGQFAPVLFGEGDDAVDGAFSEEDITYNWPYDYFSLVELVKLDTEIEFSKVEKDEKTKSRRLRPLVASKTKVKKNRRKFLFGNSAKKEQADDDAIDSLFDNLPFGGKK